MGMRNLVTIKKGSHYENDDRRWFLCLDHTEMNFTKIKCLLLTLQPQQLFIRSIYAPKICSANYLISVLSNLLEQITDFFNTQNSFKANSTFINSFDKTKFLFSRPEW